MSGSTLPDLTAGDAISDADLFYAAQSGADRKITGAQIKAYAGAVLTASRTISQTEMLTLNSVPLEIIPAPAEDEIVQLIAASFQYYSGNSIFWAGFLQWYLGYTNAPNGGALLGNISLLSYTALGYAGVNQVSSDPQGASVSLYFSQDLPVTGPVTSSSITGGHAGTGYAALDEFAVNYPDDTPGTATGVVGTVDGGGAVLTYHIVPGNAYSTATGVGTTTTTGGGSGLELDITVSTPDTGVGQVDVVYRIISLAE